MTNPAERLAGAIVGFLAKAMDDRVIVGFKVPAGTDRDDPEVVAVLGEYRESADRLAEATRRRLDEPWRPPATA